MRDIMLEVKNNEDFASDSYDKEVGLSSDSFFSESSSNLGRTTGPTRRSTKGGWTKEEDNLLSDLVMKFNGKNWKNIAACMPPRTDDQCLHRWQKVLNPELVKGSWTAEEDDLLIELVETYGLKRWSTIAKSLPGRIGKQCRERWYNNLDPAIRKDAWTEEEEQTLAYYHQIFGNKWADIARFLPGRTDNAIKNHWNGTLKRKCDKLSQAGVQATSQEPISPNGYRANGPPVSPLMTESPKWLKIDTSEAVNKACKPCTNPPTSRFDENVGGNGKRKSAQKSPAGETSHDDGYYHVPDLNSPYCHTSPTKLAQTHHYYSNYNSPESTLRKSALTFTNTPSIIRKRIPRTIGSISISNFSSSTHGNGVNSTDISISKYGWFSSFSSAHKASIAVKSLERQLAYAFNDDTDLAPLD